MLRMRAIFAWALTSAAQVQFVRTPTFKPAKCCAEHECLLQRAAPQHNDWVAKVGNGPNVPIDFKRNEVAFLNF
jgi:hypothetical protein